MFEKSVSLVPSYMSRVCYKYDKQAKPSGIWEFYGIELECELKCVVEIAVSSNSTTFMSRMSLLGNEVNKNEAKTVVRQEGLLLFCC